LNYQEKHTYNIFFCLFLFCNIIGQLVNSTLIVMNIWTSHVILCLSLTLISYIDYDTLSILRQYSTTISLLLLLSNYYIKKIISNELVQSITNEFLKILSNSCIIILQLLINIGSVLFPLLSNIGKKVIKITYQLSIVSYRYVKLLTPFIEEISKDFRQFLIIGSNLFLVLLKFIKGLIKISYGLLTIGGVLYFLLKFSVKLIVKTGYQLSTIFSLLSFLPEYFVKIEVGSPSITYNNNYKNIDDTKSNYRISNGQSINDIKPNYRISNGQSINDIKPNYRISNGQNINDIKPNYNISEGQNINDITPTNKIFSGKHIIQLLGLICLVSIYVTQIFFSSGLEFIKNFLIFGCCINYISNITGFKMKENIFYTSLLLVACDICFNPWRYKNLYDDNFNSKVRILYHFIYK